MCMPPRLLPLVRGLLLAVALTPSAAFATPPIDPPRGDFRFVVFGDFNGSYGALEYPPPVERAIDSITGVWRPDLLLSPGDVIAGQSHRLPDTRFSQMWQVFDREVAGRLRDAGIPYAVAMGNHDASSLRDGEGRFVFSRGRSAALDYWSRPMYDTNLGYVDREHYPFDYAFRAGRAFILVLDASSATIRPDGLAWLERTLALPAARSAEMRIVVGHLPLVPVGRGRDLPGEVLANAGSLRRIFEQGGVDLYVSGHHAAYYPGRLGDLELLFAGGVGARRLVAGDAPARSTVTLVDVWWEPLEIHYTTFDLSGMQLVSPASLPPVMVGGAVTLRLSERAYPAAFETAQR